MITNPKRWLRTQGAADHAGLSVSTIEKMRVEGSGPPFSKVGRVVVYDVNELDAWLAAHRQTSTSENRKAA